jgi:hypothetical protein
MFEYNATLLQVYDELPADDFLISKMPSTMLRMYSMVVAMKVVFIVFNTSFPVSGSFTIESVVIVCSGAGRGDKGIEALRPPSGLDPGTGGGVLGFFDATVLVEATAGVDPSSAPFGILAACGQTWSSSSRKRATSIGSGSKLTRIFKKSSNPCLRRSLV